MLHFDDNEAGVVTFKSGECVIFEVKLFVRRLCG